MRSHAPQRRIIRRRVRLSGLGVAPPWLGRHRAAAALACMGRVKKHVAASRGNGAKASNHGKLKSEPAAIIRAVLGERSGNAGITFEKVFRAKLHKNTKYMDELRATALLERAAQVVRACYLPGYRPEKHGGMPCAEARAILAAFEAATGGAA